MADLGIYHYNARFYSPTLGRFLSADTLVPGYANPQNLNRFSYVGNNPLRYIDPTGHMMEGASDGTRNGCSDPKYCRGGKPKTPEWKKPKGNKKDKGGNPIDTILTQPNTVIIGDPVTGGNYITGFSGAGAGFVPYNSAGFYPDEDNGVKLFGGRQSSVEYSARYAIEFYDYRTSLTIIEDYSYGMSDPDADTTTFSTLNVKSKNDVVYQVPLGDFTLSMDEFVTRETNVLFFGDERRPKNMWITITLQISNDTYFAQRAFLPYELPMMIP